MTPTVGVHKNVPMAVYLDWDAVNNSFLWDEKTSCPYLAKWRHDHPKPHTEATLLGSLTHTFILEPALFAKDYAILPDTNNRTKAGRSERDAFIEQCHKEQREPVKAVAVEQAKAIAASVQQQKAWSLLSGGQTEVCVVWLDEKTGLLCKCRFDKVWWDHDVVIDVKTLEGGPRSSWGSDASPRGFRRNTETYGYHQGAAFYSAGYESVTGRTPDVSFMPVEKKEPHMAALYRLGSESVAAGKLSFERELEVYKQCVTSGEWPGYGDAVSDVHISDWLIKAEGVNQFNMNPA